MSPFSFVKNPPDGERKTPSREAQSDLHYSGESFLLRETLNLGAETNRNMTLLLAMINIYLPMPAPKRAARPAPLGKMSLFREPAFTPSACITLQSPPDSWIVPVRWGLGAHRRRFGRI